MFDDFVKAKGIEKSDISPTMYRKLGFNYQMLTFIKSFESADGISYITKKEIAEEMGCSPSLIYKTINLLSQDGKMIEKIGKSQYKVYQTDVFIYGPFAKYLAFLFCTQKVPNFLKLSWTEQAKIMGISYEQIQRVHSWANIGMREMKDW